LLSLTSSGQDLAEREVLLVDRRRVSLEL
jgi:hypothetical protein